MRNWFLFSSFFVFLILSGAGFSQNVQNSGGFDFNKYYLEITILGKSAGRNIHIEVGDFPNDKIYFKGDSIEYFEAFVDGVKKGTMEDGYFVVPKGKKIDLRMISGNFIDNGVFKYNFINSKFICFGSKYR
jgi:hypothetical protein